MKRHRIAFPLSVLLLALAGGQALAGPPAPPISGVVRHLESPVAGVLVIVLNLGDNSLARIRTATDGTFVLSSAPAGVYELVAYKRGFEPALQRLWHQAGAEQVSAVSIKLTKKGGAAAPEEPVPTTIWDLRDRLPTDVLRELAVEEVADKNTPPAEKLRLSRLLAGELKTMTEAPQGSAAALSRAEVGLHGGLPNGWQYGITGDYAKLGDADTPGELTTGNAAGLALEVNPSADAHVVVSTRRNTLSFNDGPASLQTHAVSWSQGAEQGRVESVAARYVEETNLYRATALGTTIFPLASRTWEVNGNYSRPSTLDMPGVAVAMAYRHTDASVGPSGVGSDGVFVQSAPDADLAASTAFRVSDSLEMEAGVVARYIGSSATGYGIAPVATVRYTIGGATVYARALYRALGSTTDATAVMPRVTSIEESRDPAATRSLAVGFQRNVGRDSSIQFEVSEQRMGELVRAFFEGDFLTDFDSVYLLDGNNVRQYKAAIQQRLSNTLSGNVTVRYGSIDGAVNGASQTGYGIESNQGRFWSARAAVEVLPTKTGIAILVRGIRQDLQTPVATLANDSDKLALSVAQDLSIIGLAPFGADWKLLVALENARGTGLSENRDVIATTNRILGGVAVAF
jgi:Carboxypeptidase regulatory-like domain